MNRVLIVDDKPENLYMLRVLLEGNGCEVEEAGHGAEALVKARQRPPTLVVSDLLMPVMDGYTLLKHWKADDLLKGIPFVVYIATYTDPKDERLARNLGADDFILKPAEPEELIARIRELLAKKDRGESPAPHQPRLGPDQLLSDYTDVLVRKLEDKVAQLEHANRSLRDELAQRKKLEEQLRQSQKMDAIGQLAGGVAHDFNNLLTIISGYSDILLIMPTVDKATRDSVKAISKAAERAASLTRQLLAFGRRSMLQPRVVDLNALVTETSSMLRRLIGEDILFTTVLDPKLNRVRVDPGQIDQILMNLAINARDAMPKGGQLTIETVNVELSGESVNVHLDCKPGPHVLLAVTDTGCGMAPDVLARIFEPFFTTKVVGKGTGLGLAMVYGIVQQSGGCIHVYSEPNHGTTFKIYLPAVMEELSTRPESSPSLDIGGSETILLVEDEEAVRSLAAMSLRMHGYEVLAAVDGQDAVRVVKSRGGAVDLIVTDVVMPNLSGPELVVALRAEFSEIKVLYMSGYTDDAVIRHGLLQADVAFIQKPYSPLTLARKVRQALDKKDA